MNKFLLILLLISGSITAQDYSKDVALKINLSQFKIKDHGLNFNSRNGNLPNWDFKRILNLHGDWKFELGDNMKWAEPKFNDVHWEEIYVPSSWEDEGFPGYDGFAWYRTRFTVDIQHKISRIYLYMGYIDDVDEVYLNGHLVGFTGSMPPDVRMTDYVMRRYLLPAQYINFDGNNVLAIRVYDHRLLGGIIRGNVGLYILQDELIPDIPLAGYWNFKTGNREDWKDDDYNDNNWDKILAPLIWEVQGYFDYDGYAWYRKKFIVPQSLRNEKLILLLGMIDDLDEAYINGHLIGRTGYMKEDETRINLANHWKDLRAYSIPRSYLRYDEENVIAIRVYDGVIKGGMYDGPIGIITRDRYMRWRDQHEENFLLKLIKAIFEG